MSLIEIALIIVVIAVIVWNISLQGAVGNYRRHLKAHDENLAAQRRILDAHSGHLNVYDDALRLIRR